MNQQQIDMIIKYLEVKRLALEDVLRFHDVPSQREELSLINETLEALRQPTQQPMDANGLLPCPFCGGKALLDEITGDQYPDAFGVECSNECGLIMELRNTREEAIAWWNCRAQPPTQTFALDDPDNGLHARRQVDVDWTTVAALAAVLDGDDNPPMRALVQMLIDRATAALNQPAPSVPLTDEVRAAIEDLRALTIAYVTVNGNDLPADKHYLNATRIVKEWLAAQPPAP